jgi:short-subunit dehydrogenase
VSRLPFAQAYGPWAIVAGGSEGIGAAFADQIARRGVHLVLVARRPEPLELTAERLRRAHGVEVRTVAADLAGPAALDEISAIAAGAPIGLVVPTRRSRRPVGFSTARRANWPPPST